MTLFKTIMRVNMHVSKCIFIIKVCLKVCVFFGNLLSPFGTFALCAIVPPHGSGCKQKLSPAASKVLLTSIFGLVSWSATDPATM